MSYKDTLKLYDELIAGGCSETEARAQAQQLGEVTNIIEKIERDLYWLRIIGGAMALAFVSNWFR